MNPLHYIVFHPDYARGKTLVKAKALIDGKPSKWSGYVWVDAPGGNEDPFVFSDAWIYSYCHATQLRRTPRLNSPYLREGSYIFFCSGDAANRGLLQVDTVFAVDHVAEWPRSQHGLPPEFDEHFENSRSQLWNRHFQFPFHGHHRGTYTYVARHWPKGRDYSFLPINSQGDRARIDMGRLNPELEGRIKGKVHGKYPVALDNQDMADLLRLILSETQIQVVGDVRRGKATSKDGTSCGRLKLETCS